MLSNRRCRMFIKERRTTNLLKGEHMTYLYKCKTCSKGTVEVDKPMSESGREEKCETCGKVMDRTYTACSISTADGYKR